MKQKKKNRVALLLRWGGGHKFWMFLSVLLSLINGLCTMIPYIGIYQLMNAGFAGNCTKEFVMQIAIMIAVAGYSALCPIWLLRCCISQGSLWSIV